MAGDYGQQKCRLHEEHTPLARLLLDLSRGVANGLSGSSEVGV
jgi:hypothetical protein